MCFTAGVSLPPVVAGEEHVRAGAVPVRTGSGPERPGPRSGGAAQNPRLPGPVSSGLPVRGEPHALRGDERGHGPNGDLDIRGPLGARRTFIFWIVVVVESESALDRRDPPGDGQKILN